MLLFQRCYIFNIELFKRAFTNNDNICTYRLPVMNLLVLKLSFVGAIFIEYNQALLPVISTKLMRNKSVMLVSNIGYIHFHNGCNNV